MKNFFSPSRLSDKVLAFTETLDGISIRAGHFDLDSYSDTLFRNYRISEPEFIATAAKKRKAEFLCGRVLARDALKLLGFLPEQIAIGKNREPVFPRNSLGSISHTDQEAICAVALNSEFVYLGIDIEEVITTSTISEIEKLVIDEEEENLLCQTGLSFETAFTIAYSTKESIFKALHPSVGYYFDFSAAKIVNICTSTGTIVSSLTSDLNARLTEKTTVCGHFCAESNHVLTVVYKRRE